MPATETLRILVIPEDDGMFSAQCLEYDICTQADSIEKLKERFHRQVEIERMLSRDYTGKEFGGIGPAPEHFHALWRRAKAFEEENLMAYRLADKAVAKEEGDDT